MMPQIAPIYLEPTMIKGVDHLVHDCILHMPLAKESVLTQEDPVVWRETARSCWRTWMALDGCCSERTTRQGQVFHHEDYRRA